MGKLLIWLASTDTGAATGLLEPDAEQDKTNHGHFF